ncbi:MAG: PilZ domain-containing protein [Spirochaetaceae bacterium]|nr:PilZ domain-containing protein [Spirochaetaceae bacterium]
MPITTSQQITKWYELYKTIDVTLTKEIIGATGLDPRHVFLKCVGEQWPCVIYSTSFAGAKLIASAKTALLEKIKRANNLVSVRFSFRVEGKTDPVSFFITGRATGFAPYAQSNGDLQFMTIEYTQRPPDDLIEIMGKLLEANMNSTRRREERILLNPDSMRRLCLMSKDTLLFVQGVPRKCILRDLSFGGAKLIIVGLAKFLVGKECTLRLEMDEPREILEIKGSIVRYEDVEGRKDLAAVAVRFDDQSLPMTLKMHINDYLSQTRPSRVEDPDAAAAAEKTAVAPVAAAPAPEGGGKNGSGGTSHGQSR